MGIAGLAVADLLSPNRSELVAKTVKKLIAKVLGFIVLKSVISNILVSIAFD